MVRTGLVAMGRGEHTLRHESFRPNRTSVGDRRSVL
jgi:hypothetical protein